MSDPVPAIREADATGAVAAIFADIRAVFGVGVVNLIWRHLAVFPGGLEWAWGSLRPLYAEGHMPAAAARLRARLTLPTLPEIPREALEAAGVPAEALGPIHAILAAYDRTNPMALVALTLLQEAAKPGFTPGPLPKPMAHDTAEALPLPPLPDLSALAPSTAALVLRLNAIGAGEAPILASMYRHLGYWPGYLALAWAVLAPLDARAIIAAGQAAAREEARALGSLLPPQLPPPPPGVLPALEAFTADAIGRMVPLCAILRRVSPGLQTAYASP
jgi:hypothetical protein